MNKIHASIILEILGKPADHVKKALEDITTKIDSEKGISILNKTLHEPIPVQDSKTLFTTFAELDVEIESIDRYFALLFTYMPAHVEITKPENLSLSNSEFNEIGNKIVQKLHEYDAITKKTLMDKEFAVNKLKEVAPHLFKTEEKKINASSSPPAKLFHS